MIRLKTRTRNENEKKKKTINCVLLCVDYITQDQEKSFLTLIFECLVISHAGIVQKLKFSIRLVPNFIVWSMQIRVILIIEGKLNKQPKLKCQN